MPARKKPVTKTKTVKKAAPKKAAPKKPVKRAAAQKATTPRFTYVNLTFSEKDHETYDAAVGHAREELGEHHKNFINGTWVAASDDRERSRVSPADTRIVVSYVPGGTKEDAIEAIRAARLAKNEWGRMPYKKRVDILNRAADLMYERAWQAAALMAYEVGKPRAEGIAEVYEGAELIRYYCEQMLRNKGFAYDMLSPGKNQYTKSLLVPYGVFGVISPWNFPLALLTGMSSAALVAGNTVVAKPAGESPAVGLYLARCLADAGLPPGAFNLVSGPASVVGEEIRANEGVDGLAFTGSYESEWICTKLFQPSIRNPSSPKWAARIR